MPPRRQSDLFEAASSAPTSRDLRISPQGGTPLGKEQQHFNRSLTKVQKLRGELAAWSDFDSHLRQQVGERMLPLRDAMTQVRRDLILQSHETLAGRAGGTVAGATERRQLTQFLLELCEAHLSEADDDAIIAVHDRYADRPFAELQAEEREWARIADEVCGDDDLANMFWEEDVAGVAGDAAEQADPAADEEPASPRGKRGNARAQQRQAEQAAAAEQAAREMSQSVREVYRKLAGALHPDRAADDTERDRRHQLMQRVNRAYESADLLSLLTLQLEIEQIDEDHLATVSLSRLGHYNQILLGQVKKLEQELREVTDRIRMLFPVPPENLSPGDLQHQFECALVEASNELEELRQHADDLLEPHYRRQWLREYEQDRQEDEDMMTAIEAMLRDEDEVSIDSALDLSAPDRAKPGEKKSGKSHKRKRKRR